MSWRSRAVYFVKTDCPAPYLVAIHGAIATVNKRYYGKKKQVDVLRFVELTARDSRGLYEAIIHATSPKVLQEFYVEVRKRNASDALEYCYPDYTYDRFFLDLQGDGRAQIWVAPTDTCIHVGDADICDRPFSIAYYKPSKLVVKEALFVGPNSAVRNALRRYRFTKQAIREGWRSKAGTPGMTVAQWTEIAEALGTWANIFLFTTEGTVIKVSRKGMEWVRPEDRKSKDYFTRMVHNGYTAIEVPATLREYDRNRLTRNQSAFGESMITMSLTHEVEANRR